MRSLRIQLVMLLFACLFTFATSAQAKDAQEIDQAVRAAEAWLALVDAGDYDGSWAAAAPVFQSGLGKAEWAKAASDVRTPLGRLVSRTFESADQATSLPGVPAGQYVVIRYETEFHDGGKHVETITPAMVGDGKWKVAGYYVN